MLAVGQKIRVLAAFNLLNCTQETMCMYLVPANRQIFSALREFPSIQMMTNADAVPLPRWYLEASDSVT